MKKFKSILIFILLLLGMSIFPYIFIELFHINITTLSNQTKVIFELICDISYMLIVYLIYRKELNDNFKSYFKNLKKNFDISIKYYIIGYLIMIISNIIITSFFITATAANENAVRSLIDRYPLYMFFSVSIYAPFVEEIIFRKCIYDIVYSFKNNKYTKYLYIALSGLIFAGVHVIGVAEKSVDYLYIIPYAGIGCAFAALYQKTKNIFSTITMHSLHNTISILRYFKGV